MNIVDWLLLGAIIVFALVGWRKGFVAGALSFIGFLGGGLVAVLWLPDLVEGWVEQEVWRIPLVIVGVLVCAFLGQAGLSFVGRRIRDSITWRPVRMVDSLAGAVLNVLALSLVAWVIASVVVYLPASDLTRQVTNSVVLSSTDKIVPGVARSAFTTVRDMVGSTAVPRVFAGLAPIPGSEVEAPPEQASTEAVAVLRESTVRLSGVAADCGDTVSGSGFVVGSDLVVTSAHVVAGVENIRVRIRNVESQKSEVVYFDPNKDIALVRTRGLDARPVRLAQSALKVEQSGVVTGFPAGERFQALPVRVRTLVTARGDSIYGQPGAERQVYVLRGELDHGISGEIGRAHV